MIHSTRYLTLLILLFSFGTKAQTPLNIQNVFFQKNKSVLAESEIAKIEKLANLLSDSVESYNLFLRGFADADADSVYNMRLSEKRCNEVRRHLINFGIDSGFISLKALGENMPIVPNVDEINKSKNRRVEIVIKYQKQTIKYIPVIDTCSTDTLVDLGSSFFASFNKCDFLQNKGCYSIKIYPVTTCIYKCSRIKLFLRMKKTCKCVEPIVNFRFSISNCKDSCFKHPVTLLFPSYHFKNKKIYKEYTESIKSGKQPNYLFKRKRIKKVSYETITVWCPGGGGMNCGGVRCGNSNIIKLKLKNRLEFANDTFKYHIFQFKKRKNLRLYNVNYVVPNILVKDNQNGDSVKLENVPLTSLRPGLLRAKNYCHSKKFLFIHYYARLNYKRKYKIKRKDLNSIQKGVLQYMYEVLEYIN